MLGCLRSVQRSPTTTNKFPPILSNKISPISQNPNLAMDTRPNSKRPTCPNCSKPIAVCLCTRLKSPNLDNKIHVTILQHVLEKKHPLNSAKIAKLGLRNVDVFTVTDVNFEAQFDIQVLEEECGMGLVQEECARSVCGNASEGFEVQKTRKRGIGQVGEPNLEDGSVLVSDFEQLSDCFLESIDETVGVEGSGGGLAEEDGRLVKQSDASLMSYDLKMSSTSRVLMRNNANKPSEEPLMRLRIGKKGKWCYIDHKLKVEDGEKTAKFEDFINCPESTESLAGGFMVTKLQQKQNCETIELEEFEEFSIIVPPGSAVLFPAKDAVEIKAIEFEVKNLIVLDGTWAKAKRMYVENPWLRLLPCVSLHVEKLSLFCEVRREPKPGYLSTIESIVYALQAFGETENLSGLDNLLEVLESMVEDQRRCKDERLKKISST